MNSNSRIINGKILPTIIKVSTPVLLGMIFELLYNLADTFFISLIDKTSSSYIAGMGLIFPIIFLIIAVATGFVNGISTLIAIEVGKRDFAGVHKVFNSAVVLVFFATLLILIFFGSFYKEIIYFLGGNKVLPETLIVAKNYFVIYLLGIPFLLFSKVFQGILQGEGKTKLIAKALSISVISNIILDPIFIFTFNLKESGAALVTVLSQIIFLALVYYFSKNNEYTKELKFDKKMFSTNCMKDIAKQGIPSAIGLVIMSLSFMVFNNIVASIGEEYLTAYTLAGRFDSILFTPLMALNVGVSMMIGQNYGFGKIDRIIKIYKAGVFLSISCLLVLSIPYIIFANEIFEQFSDVQKVIEIASHQIYHLTIIIALSASIGFMSRAYFQAIKKPMYALILVVLRLGLIAIPLAKILISIFGNNIELVWYSLMIGGACTGIIGYLLVTRDYKKLILSKK